jgi:hypothetical protein
MLELAFFWRCAATGVKHAAFYDNAVYDKIGRDVGFYASPIVIEIGR